MSIPNVIQKSVLACVKARKEINYHQRSRVETHMFRDKTILGDRLTARREWSQTTEVNIRLDILNRMTELGRPILNGRSHFRNHNEHAWPKPKFVAARGILQYLNFAIPS
jgi:hypothetical protein